MSKKAEKIINKEVQNWMKTFNANYILDDQGNPVSEPDIIKWSKWFENNHKTPLTCTQTNIDGFLVSTIFLGIDHSFNFFSFSSPSHDPELWETIIFKGEIDHGNGLFAKTIYLERYTSKKEADLGHLKACELVKLGEDHILSLGA